MSPTILALIAVACIFGGTLLGLVLRRLLPADHLSADSKEVVKLTAGMISVMAALVLGLLLSASKSKFDSTTDAVTQSGARIILLDRVLASYGSESNELRADLRRGVVEAIEMLWPEDGSGDSRLSALERAHGMEELLAKLRALTPRTDAQRAAQAQALQIGNELLLTRWLQIEQAQVVLPTLYLVILLFWLTMLYMSFGLLAPGNPTAIAMMFIGAVSLATALFLILEMNDPMNGVIKVSSGPMRKALEHIGQ